MPTVRVLAAIALIVVAGCSGASNTDSTPAAVSTTVPTSTEATEEPTTTRDEPAPPTTRTPTPDPPGNPWQREPVTVAISTPADHNRNYTTVVERAIRYWNTTGAEHAEWAPVFAVDPDSERPDIVVQFVNEIHHCGIDTGGVAIGCASRLEADDRPAHPEYVRVNLGLTNASTYRVVRHELGHILGLEHGEGPGEAMAPYDRVYHRVLRVHIDYDNTATLDRRETKEQVRHAAGYYSNGADGFMEEHVEFAIVEEREAADIVINFVEYGGQSTARYENRTYWIRVEGIKLDNRGWHVGVWLGFYFGAASNDELPPPFDEPDADERERWW